jgi:hypothetical protein
VAESDGVLHLRVRDDGRCGADFSQGSGLIGLKDRAEALGGQLQVRSPPGAGTTLDITLPLDEPGGPPLPPEAANRRRTPTAARGPRLDALAQPNNHVRSASSPE